MKAVICLCALVVFAAARPEDQYTDRYDDVDVMPIISNKRLLDPYVKCGLEQGKCTSEAKELRSHLKEALETYCAKCTRKQKEATRIVIAHLINKEPVYWSQLSAKYDKDGKYAAKYEEELKTIS